MDIYRLENSENKGPFEAKDINLAHYISFHKSPKDKDMLKSAGLSKKKFNELMEQGYIFGWCSDEHYKNFFLKRKTDNEKKAYSLGMKKMLYSSEDFYLFFDGQVLFNPNSPKTDITPKIATKNKKKSLFTIIMDLL